MHKKTKNKFIFLIVFLSLFFAYFAEAEVQTLSEELGGVIISRIAPDKIYLGQKIWITLVFENNSSLSKTIVFKENLGNADFDRTEAKNIETEYGEKFWYYDWKIQLKAGENTAVSYWLIPKEMGLYTISSSRMTVAGENYNLGSWNINVECLADEKCDLSAGENYLNCPYDCSTGLADNICDGVEDGKCDPDCEQGIDPDCEKSSIKSQNRIYLFLGGAILIIFIFLVFKKKILKRKI